MMGKIGRWKDWLKISEEKMLSIPHFILERMIKMSSAFRCDVCGQYYEGTPLTHRVYASSPRSYSDNWIENIDVCYECNKRRKELYRKIAIENNYISGFVEKSDLIK